MPLTIHCGETEDEARRTVPELSLDYQTHQQIFGSFDLEFHDLGLFFHLSDFHQDTAFLGADVITLRAQIEEARRRIQNSRATDSLARLSRICDSVIRNGGNLFAFGES